MRSCLLLLALSSCAHVPTTPPQGLVDVMSKHVRRDGPNHLHMLRLARLAPRLTKAEGVSARIVEAAVLLHDATKEDGAGTAFERFCTHHEQGAALALAELPGLGYGADEVEAVASAISQHMGPLGENPDFHAPRFMTGFCKREFPTPLSPEAKVVFDLDMLDLMTVDGVVKVVTLRQRNAEFAKEPLQASALTGADSAWKSVVDARQVLLTRTGQACGAAVEAHSRAFLDSLDFGAVTTVEAFTAAAKAYLSRRPLPECVSP
jgi:hypothetical protein